MINTLYAWLLSASKSAKLCVVNLVKNKLIHIRMLIVLSPPMLGLCDSLSSAQSSYQESLRKSKHNNLKQTRPKIRNQMGFIWATFKSDWREHHACVTDYHCILYRPCMCAAWCAIKSWMWVPRRHGPLSVASGIDYSTTRHFASDTVGKTAVRQRQLLEELSRCSFRVSIKLSMATFDDLIHFTQYPADRQLD